MIVKNENKLAPSGPRRANKYHRDRNGRGRTILVALGAVILLLAGYLAVTGTDTASVSAARSTGEVYDTKPEIAAPAIETQPIGTDAAASPVEAELPPAEPPEASPAVEPDAAPENTPDSQQVNLASISPGPFQRICDWQSGLKSSTETVGEGESLSVVMERLGFSASQAHSVFEAMQEVMDLRKVRAGAELKLYRRKDSNRAVRLELGRGNNPRLVMINTPTGWAASWQEDQPVACLSSVEGSIKNTLWGSAVQLYGLSPELVLDFTDIFAYDVDFFTDIRAGDQFGLLFEEEFRRGVSVGPGRILAAYFVNSGRKMEAFYYSGADGQGGYYDEQGRSLRKMFLKSPLQYRRISSFFSKSRMHPILKIRRPHLGVDYSAPTGTPVEALGGGRVTFIGRKGGYGNFIVLSHPQNYETMYGHLSRFAKGLHKGDRVQQGQLIGYVGATGLATGPHLDFRVKKGSTFIDPLSLKSEPAHPIKSSEKDDFLALVSERRSAFSSLTASVETNSE